MRTPPVIASENFILSQEEEKRNFPELSVF